MKKIGMLVAVEMEAVLAKYGNQIRREQYRGYEVLVCETEKYMLYIVNSGAGEIKAAAATQFLISVLECGLILNYGVVGALTPELSLAKTCVVERVVHYDMDTSAVDPVPAGTYTEYGTPWISCTEELVKKAKEIHPELISVTCASGDKFIADAAKKQELAKRFDAQICEMELAAIALICHRNQIPFLSIKSISDSIEGGAEEFHQEIFNSAGVCLEIAHTIIELL